MNSATQNNVTRTTGLRSATDIFKKFPRACAISIQCHLSYLIKFSSIKICKHAHTNKMADFNERSSADSCVSQRVMAKTETKRLSNHLIN